MEEVKVLGSGRNELHVEVNGKTDADHTVLFVHGLGTGMNEGSGLSRDIANAIGTMYRTVRFDFAGCGKSAGLSEQLDLATMRIDLEAVINWIREAYTGKLTIIAHSLGTFVVAALCPDNIHEAIFIGILDPNAERAIAATIARIIKMGGTFDETGITRRPRSDGSVTLLGPTYWQTRRKFDAVQAIETFSLKTPVLMIHGYFDQLTRNVDIEEEYIPATSVLLVEMEGDHDFTGRFRTPLVKAVQDNLGRIGAYIYHLRHAPISRENT